MSNAPALWKPMLLSVLLSLGACTQRSDSQLLTSARAYLAKHDMAAASIELKNLLQQNPQSGEARLLLGKIQLESGDAAGAEVYFLRALDAGRTEDEVLPLLARAMVAQQKYPLLVQQYGAVELKDDRAASELKTEIAIAHIANKSPSNAEAAVENALHRSPAYPPAALLQARLTAARGGLEPAMRLVDAMLAASPGNAQAWNLKGELLTASKRADRAPAIAAYRKALELQPDLVTAHSAVLTLLLEQRDFDAFGKQLEVLKKALPRHPETQYFEGVQALHDGDAKRVRDITAALLRGPRQDWRVLLLAGQAEIALNSMTQAEVLLLKSMQLAPAASPPRLMLAQVYLRSGQADKSLAVLKPLSEQGAQDADFLALMGRSQLMAGDAKAAEASFAGAAQLNPRDKRIDTSAALSRLGQGKSASALDELASIAATDPGTTADLALISERMRRKEFDAALKAVNTLALKQPQMALPEFLRGRIALQRRDATSARKSFEAALTKDPGFFQAVASLAALDVSEGKPEAARARFEAEIKRDPANTTAHIALAALAVRQGVPKEQVAQLLEAGVKANPAATAPRAALIDQYMNTGNPALALSTAIAAVAAIPDNPDLLDRLGRVQQQSGDINQAILTFTKMAALLPTSALPQLRLADAHTANKSPDAAAAAIRRALQAEPRSLDAQRAGVALAVTEKQPAQALAIARMAQAQRPESPWGYKLEGEIELSRQKYEPAIAALRKALTKPDSDDAAPLLHRALRGANKTAEADRMAADWMKAHPDDANFGIYLGSVALSQKNPALAEQRYRDVLKRSPDNVNALNNLAYVLTAQKKPGGVALAEKAVKLAPDEPALMDTLALSYALDNQLPKALALQARVVAADPAVPSYRLTLAKLQIESGDKLGARAELSRLAALGPAFGRQDEVARLVAALGN